MISINDLKILTDDGTSSISVPNVVFDQKVVFLNQFDRVYWNILNFSFDSITQGSIQSETFVYPKSRSHIYRLDIQYTEIANFSAIFCYSNSAKDFFRFLSIKKELKKIQRGQKECKQSESLSLFNLIRCISSFGTAYFLIDLNDPVCYKNKNLLESIFSAINVSSFFLPKDFRCAPIKKTDNYFINLLFKPSKKILEELSLVFLSFCFGLFGFFAYQSLDGGRWFSCFFFAAHLCSLALILTFNHFLRGKQKQTKHYKIVLSISLLLGMLSSLLIFWALKTKQIGFSPASASNKGLVVFILETIPLCLIPFVKND